MWTLRFISRSHLLFQRRGAAVLALSFAYLLLLPWSVAAEEPRLPGQTEASSEVDGEDTESTLPGTLTATGPVRYLIDTGPLRVRDQFPLGIGFLAFDPVSAVVLEPGSWQVDLITTMTNTWAQSEVVEDFLLERTSRQPFGQAELDALQQQNPDEGIFLFDSEMIRTAVALRRGIGRGIQLELVVPLINFSGGVLDGPIEGFHDAFGFDQAGREGVERNNFFASIRGASGSIFMDEDPGTTLGDIVIGAKFRLREPNGSRLYHLALETVAELPTGDEDAFSSNGSLDLGAQLLYTRYFETACLHLSGGLLYLGEWEELGIDAQVLPSFMAAWEQGLNAKTAVLLQGTVSQTPFDDLEIDELSETSIQLTLGIKRVVFDNKVLFLGVTENVQNFDNTADVGLHFGITWTDNRLIPNPFSS